MIIRQASQPDACRWNSYVHQHPQATPYHLFAWGQAVRAAYGFKTYQFLAEENSNICGIVPLTLFKLPFRRGHLVSQPYCDIGSLLADNPAIEKQLFDKVMTIGQNIKVKTVELRGGAATTAFKTATFPVQDKTDKVRMLLELPGSSEELLQSFKSKLRSQIRKAEKNGLTFQFANSDLIDEFYLVFRQNMKDLGSPVHSKKWFEQIIKHFGDAAKIGMVYKKDIAIGAGIILRVGNKISIPWASTLREHNHLNPNMLLYWNFLKFAADNGCHTFDFGRSTPGEGTYRFKAQWGAQPKPLTWHKIYLQGQPLNGISDSVNKRALVERAWQKLPLGLANLLGPIIRKYISL